MIYLKSTCLRSVLYEPVSRILTVWFQKNPKAYDYGPVPAHIYQELLDAPSHGKYFDKHISKQYAMR